MFRLFFKTATRNLLKDKFHSFLNIIGLAVGLTAFLYIITFIGFETDFDKFHSKAKQTYRCCADIKFGDEEQTYYTAEAILASAVKEELPEVETYVRIYVVPENIVRYKDNRFNETQIICADNSFFDVFDFELLEGDKNSVLTEPYSILLTKNAVKKYFGNSPAINKTLIVGEDRKSFTVKGILNNIPENSHLQFSMVASLSSLSYMSERPDWGGNFNFLSYIVLKENTDIQLFEDKYSSCIRKHWAPLPEKYMGITLEEFESQGKYFRHWLQPLNAIHLHSKSSDDIKNRGNIQLLIILGITGLLIIIIACVNFVNLNIARSNKRSKEIGIKKIFGSNRKQLISGFLFESFLHCLIALLLSVNFLMLLFPVLNNYTGISLGASNLFDYRILIVLIILLITLAFLSGGYLAFGISKFKAIDMMKEIIIKGKNSNLVKGSLVSFQFIIFILLVLSSLVIRKQIKFLITQNPGFNKENVLVVKNADRLGNNLFTFKDELIRHSNIISASYSSAVPTVANTESNLFSRKGDENSILMDRMRVDYDFAKVFKVNLLDGRFFDENLQEDNNVIINKRAASLLGWRDCNERQLHYYQGVDGYDLNVIGIIDNFHLKSFHEDVKPLVIFLSDEENSYFSKYSHLSLRFSDNAHSTTELVKEKWDKYIVDAPMEYFFLDQSFAEQYKSENQLARILGLFTILAISIACLGLLGLVSFMANRRQKEIGIRKVNGAKTGEILALLNKDFLKWIVIAYIIACPIAWWFMNKWLQNFVYRTTISWWVFTFAGLITIFIALLTVSWQSWSAANKNPVQALQYE
jgi:putative ABC transport system permease protein